MKKLLTIAALLLGFAMQLHAQAIKTELVDSAGVYKLYRSGVPYIIKGAAANSFPTTVADFGGNTIRTYSINDSTGRWLDSCYAHGIAVCLGLGIRKGIQMNYHDTGAVNTQFRLMKEQVLLYKDHPAVLLWAIGNEADASYPDTATALWTAINDIAAMIHAEDTNHLTTTVLVNSAVGKVQTIIAEVPELDILSINSYAPNLPGVLGNLQTAGWVKPYMITEFGPRGTWQMNPEPKRIMPWGGLVEQTSTEKAVVYKQLLENYIEANRPNNCLGGFVFLWGYQSSGDVMTWYGLHTRLGESFGGADELQYVWSGAYPANRAPVISSRNNFTCNGKVAEDTVILEANSVSMARVIASDPENDSLRYEWLLIPEGSVMSGGDPAASLPSISGFLIDQLADSCHFKAPAVTGNYRLYVYVHDGNGKLASAVIPFKVIPSSIGQWIVSTATGGNWNAAGSWQGGVVPSNADSVEIIAGSTITINTSPVVAYTKLTGTLGFNTTTTNTFTTGDLRIDTGAVFNPYNGTTGRKITVKGNLVNNGATNFSKTGTTLIMGEAADSTYIGGTGVYTTGVFRNITIDNPHGVRLNVTASIPGILQLASGVLNNGAYLTMDNTIVGGSSSSTFCQVQRSQAGSLASSYTLGSTAALYVNYITNTNYSPQAVTEGYEIPSSRSFHNITINNAQGVTINDDLTLKSSNSAIVLTNGIIHLAAGKTLTCTNTAYPGAAGSAASFVDGAVALSNGTTAVTRTFPIGSSGGNRKVILSGVASASGALVVRFAIDTAAGTGLSDLSATRRWQGSVVSGTLGQYSSIGIDYGSDDGSSFTLIGKSCSHGGVYDAMPSGSAGSSQVVSGSGTYTSLGWFTPASDGNTLRGPALIAAIPSSQPVLINSKVFPNPSTGLLNIRSAYLDEATMLMLADMQGRIILQKMIDVKGMNQYSWQLERKPLPGLYLLTIAGRKERETVKVWIE